MKPVATIVHRQIAMELADVIVVIRLSEPKKPKYLHENFHFDTPLCQNKTVFVSGRLSYFVYITQILLISDVNMLNYVEIC